MKKMLIIFVLVSVVFGLYSEENLLWCKKLLFNEPTKYVIQRGDYFSKLSQRYYGTTSYWRELALINRAPNKNMVFPGEEIILPSLEAIQKIRNSRSLTDVNKVVKDQNDWIAKYGNITTPITFDQTQSQQFEKAVSAPTAQQQPAAKETSMPSAFTFDTKPLLDEKLEKSSVLPVLLTILAIALIVGLMVLYLHRRKMKYELEAFEPLEKEADADTENGEAVYSDPFLKNKRDREREPVLAN